MAEPLSIAASIITVVQVADQVLTCCYSYVGKVKSAAADIDKAVQETSLLKGLLLNLYELAQDESDNERLKALVAPMGPLSICAEALEEIEAKLRSVSTKLMIRRRLLWPFESQKLEEILERIRKQKPVLILSMVTDTADISRRIQTGVRDIQNSLESVQSQEKREKILNWLRPNDPKDKHLTSRRKHEQGTNQWILNHPMFLKWTQEAKQHIWLHGIPGCGKTIMCSTIIEHLEKLCQSRSNSRLAYYYLDFNDTAGQKLNVLLRSLIFQLCVRMDSIPDVLSSLYDECDRGRSNPSDQSLVENFFNILSSEEQAYLVIDGLDECPYGPQDSERSRFEDFILCEIGQHPGNYNFLFTSRKEFDIEESMKDIAKRTALHIIGIQADDVDSDVRLHVRHFVSQHKRISKWSASVREEIEDELVKGSQGMFRWVECQLQIIGGCVLPGVARKKLKQLPGSLYDSYDRILESISEENISAVRSALMFLAHAIRPITIEELAEAVLINVDEQSFDHEERSDDPLSVVLELCSSLVAVTKATESDGLWSRNNRLPLTGLRGYGSSNVVRFAHYSVKEYITSERNKHTALALFYFSELDAHQHIAQAQLLYMLTVAISGNEVTHPRYENEKNILRFYSSQYWPQHCSRVPSDQRSNLLVELIHALFNTEDPRPYIYWLNSYDQDYQTDGHLFSRHGRNLSDFAPPIYFASLLGELSTCQWLISNGYSIDDPSGYCQLGDPLQAAALGNHVEIVQLLLDSGAEVNTDHGYFGDPLQAAAFGGGLKTIELLIENGAILNSDHGEYGNALIAAAHGGHLEVAKKLIKHGADPELSSRNHGKAIAGAAATGQVELVKLLLTKGNDINDPNEPTGSALYCASKQGDLKLVQLLIKAGADINLGSGKMHTAIQAACNEGHIEVVKVLLANGADVNSFGGRLDSALQACIDHGDLNILQLLLSHGADLNHEGGLYRSPLHCATFRGKVRAAEILLDRGADFNDEIFLMAIRYEYESLVKRMLSKGVDVNAQGKKGTALQLAICNKDMETTRALLTDSRIDIDARGGEYGDTALQLALAQGNEEISTILVQKGASVSIEGGEYFKPLTAAVVGGNEKLIHLILDKGADINGHRGGWYDSALNVASSSGLENIVNLLLDRGMDVNEFSGKNKDSMSTALQCACVKSNVDLAKLLISRGADINAPTGKDGNALSCTIGFKGERNISDDDTEHLMNYLLEHGADVSCPGSKGGCSGYHKISTPLDRAIQLGKHDRVNTLLSHGAQFCPNSLRIAASQGDDDIMKRIIASGADGNAGVYPLCDAIERGNASTIQLLLGSGIDINVQKEGKFNYGCALGYAVEEGDYGLVETLLERGANANAMAGQFGSVLRHAVVKGETAIATLLIQKGADVNTSTDDLRSPLTAAVTQNNDSMISQLLDAGADVDVDGGDPLLSACRSGKIHIVKLLLDAGAEPHVQQGVPEHALQIAARWGHVDICKLLIALGADVNAQGGENGNPLRAVLSNGNICRTDKAITTVNYLLNVGADVNAPPSKNYVSTLQAAVSNGNGMCIDALIKAGADVNTYNPQLGTALISAAFFANIKWAYKLLEYGADPHLTGGPHGSALHAAARHGKPELVRSLLLDRGVSANLVAGNHGHVLQAACNPRGAVDYLPCIRLLLQQGSDVNARGGKYDTALQCAAKHGKLDAVRILLEHGADPLLSGGEFGTATEAAKAGKHWHVLNHLQRYIQEHGKSE